MRLLKCALRVGKGYPHSVKSKGLQETEIIQHARHTSNLLILVRHAVSPSLPWALGVEIMGERL